MFASGSEGNSSLMSEVAPESANPGFETSLSGVYNRGFARSRPVDAAAGDSAVCH